MDIQTLLNQFKGFMNNPVQYMMSNRLNIPQEMLNNPSQSIQYLLNTGKITQQQYDWAVNQAKNLQNNNDFKNLLNNYRQ